MQTTQILKDGFQISNNILQAFPLYISITSQFEDHNLMQNHDQVIQDIQIAYAVGVVFNLLIDQNVSLLEDLTKEAQMLKNKEYLEAIQTIEFSVYQLYKNDSLLYLGTILNNKQISEIELNTKFKLTTSSIYSFVLRTKLYKFFDQIELSKRVPFQCIKDSNFDPYVPITLYQNMSDAPVIVLIRQNELQLVQYIQNQHKIFLQDISKLLISASKQQQSPSTLVSKLKNQPFNVNSYQQFCKLLFVFDEQIYQEQLSNKTLENFFNNNLQSQNNKDDPEAIKLKLINSIVDKAQLDAQKYLRQYLCNSYQNKPDSDKQQNIPIPQQNNQKKVNISFDNGEQYVMDFPTNQNIIQDQMIMFQIILWLHQQGKIQHQLDSVELQDQAGNILGIYKSMQVQNLSQIKEYQLKITNVQNQFEDLINDPQMLPQPGMLSLIAMNFNWKDQNENETVYQLPFDASLTMMQISEKINSKIEDPHSQISFFRNNNLLPEYLPLSELEIDEQSNIHVEIRYISNCDSKMQTQKQEQQQQQSQQQEQELNKQNRPQRFKRIYPQDRQNILLGSQNTPTDLPQESHIITSVCRSALIRQNYQDNHFFFDKFSIQVDFEGGSFLVYKFQNCEGSMSIENGKKICNKMQYDFKPLSQNIQIAIFEEGFLIKWPNDTFNSIKVKRKG